MSSKDCWGKTSHEIIKIYYTWTIENFGLLRNVQLDKGLKSPKFPDDESGLQFCLELFPAKSAYGADLSVCLNTVSNSSVRKGYVKMYLPGRSADFKFHGFTLSEPMTLFFNNFFKERGVFLNDEKLILHCEIALIGSRIEKSGLGNVIKVPNCKLSEDLGAILNVQEFSDVTIVTADGHKIPAHKLILSGKN